MDNPCSRQMNKDVYHCNVHNSQRLSETTQISINWRWFDKLWYSSPGVTTPEPFKRNEMARWGLTGSNAPGQTDECEQWGAEWRRWHVTACVRGRRRGRHCAWYAQAPLLTGHRNGLRGHQRVRDGREAAFLCIHFYIWILYHARAFPIENSF